MSGETSNQDLLLNLSGVILAGGQNRRMGGKSKALLPIMEERVIERQIRLMRIITKEIIVVTNEPELFRAYLEEDILLITDQLPGCGPLSGLQAALSVAKYGQVWMVACDMPFISLKAAQVMLEMKQKKGCDAVIPSIDKQDHPMHGIYDISCLQAVSNMLEKKQFHLKGLLDLINCEKIDEEYFQRIGVNLDFVFNMNTPMEYEFAKEKSYEKSSNGEDIYGENNANSRL